VGIRKRIKSRIKRVLGVEPAASSGSVAPAAPAAEVENSPRRGNLSGGEDVPWYLKYDDLDGWDSTDAKDDLDSE
jgi:hypothetical protein